MKYEIILLVLIFINSYSIRNRVRQKIIKLNKLHIPIVKFHPGREEKCELEKKIICDQQKIYKLIDIVYINSIMSKIYFVTSSYFT